MMKLGANLRKLYLNSRQYRKRLSVCPFPPTRLWIEPTNLCNLNCPICPSREASKRVPTGYMDFKLYTCIIDQIRDYAVDINLFDRGEPLLHPRLSDMIRYAKQQGLRVRVETNATLLGKEQAEALLDSGLDFISFSFDGYTRQVYESIRKGADYDKTLSNILRFLELKKQRRQLSPYTLVQVIETKHLAGHSTARDKADFRKHFSRLPVNGFRITLPHRFGGRIDSSVVGSKYGYVNEKNRFFRLSYLPCPYLWYGFTILWNGAIVPCCMNFFEEYAAGDAKKDTILDAWNSTAMTELRKKISAQKYRDVSMCEKCDLLWQHTLWGFSIKNIKDLFVFIKESAVRQK